jgi:very-short-patch-repair endonuclease
MTRAEVLLWRQLKAHHIEGLGFRRQVPIGRYITDFICHEARLIVELDGESHDFDSRQRSDQERDAWFGANGFAVLRFTNRDVMKNLEGVVAAISDTARARLVAPPSLSLPHKGGGNPKIAAAHVRGPKRAQGRIES